MCDYSLQAVKSRPAVVGDKLVVTNFGMGTRGFADTVGINDPDVPVMAVCVLPGTELAFAAPVICVRGFPFDKPGEIGHTVARFRQVDKEHQHTHHDALEFPDGNLVMLTHLSEGQQATVLQLPAAPRNEMERQEQTRVAYAG